MLRSSSDGSRDLNTRHLESLLRGAITPESRDALFSACRRELRAAAGSLMRGERRDHTLQPTALVNEAYLRLFDATSLPIEGKAHFVNLVARAMRQILAEHARRRNAAKRGGGWQSTTLSNLQVKDLPDQVDLLDLNDALAKLEIIDSRAVQIVDLRIFGGLTMEEIAAVVGVTRRTVQSDWKFAVLWLRRELADLGCD